MLNISLNTKQDISGMLFPDNLMASTEKKSEKPGEAISKI